MPRTRGAARTRRRGEQAHEPQEQELARARRRLAEPLDGGLQVVGAALGQRQRGVGHAAQLHALLRAGGGDRPAEVLARAASRRSARPRGRRGSPAPRPVASSRARAPRRSGPPATASRRARSSARPGPVAASAARPESSAPAGLLDCAADADPPSRAPRRLLAVLALAAPAVAGAQQAPSLGAPTQSQPTPTVATTASSSGGGLETWQELLIFGAGVVLLARHRMGDRRRRAEPRAGRRAPVGRRGRSAGSAPPRRGAAAPQAARAPEGPGRARVAQAQPLGAARLRAAAAASYGRGSVSS